MGSGRLAVLVTAVVSGGATVALASILRPVIIYENPSQQVAFETATSLVALAAGILVLIRLRRQPQLNHLLLAAALAVMTLSNLIFAAVPVIAGSVQDAAAAAAAIEGRSVGCVLFAAAAFAPRLPLRRPGGATAIVAAGTLAALVAIAVLLHVFEPDLAQDSVPVLTQGLSPSFSDGHPGLAGVQIFSAVLDAAAVAGYLSLSRRLGDEFFRWLAVAAVFAVAAHVNYVLYPTMYAQVISVGDLFRLCFYLALLAGSLREIWAYWRTLPEAVVAQERQRIARDLHDGLSQELAYLTRNLHSLKGTADEATLRHLHSAVRRAQLESRLTLTGLRAPRYQPINEALADAAGEVAKRFGLDLELDLAPGIWLHSTRGEALLRIACEALVNAALHSGSSQVSVFLDNIGPRALLRVSDRGHGFDAAACAAGFGLTSMRDRARSVGGELRISSEPGNGSTVEATL